MANGDDAHDIRQPPTVQMAASGFRPSYMEGDRRKDRGGGSASDYLDFKETHIILGDSAVSEDEFRNKIAYTIMQLDDLGLNRQLGKQRAEACLDVVTWDDKVRASWKDDYSQNSSSCAMFVRNTWWLCGLRGSNTIMNQPYDWKNNNVMPACKDYDSFSHKPLRDGKIIIFCPKVGDVLYLLGAHQHISTICSIDPKTIVVENGGSTVYNDDGSLATKVTITGIDGGQFDGVGPDSKGKQRKWGCQAIKKQVRTLKLKNGHFKDLGSINTWIDVGEMKDQFTANYIEPVRKVWGKSKP